MTPRNMQIDFTGVPIAWSPNKAYGIVANSGSPSASAFEPYLNKVMARARDQLAGRDPVLHRNINLFIAQEGHHYRVHRGLNKVLYQHYPKMQDFEDEFNDALGKQFETRSLAYNLAYCAGFENFACYAAKFAFDRAQPCYEGANIRMKTLWLWHLAEEFEHRAACSDVLNAVSGNYFVRMRGFFVYLRDTFFWQTRLINYMIEVDLAAMPPEEKARFMRQKKQNERALLGYLLPRMVFILLPFYNPSRQKAPDALNQALAEFTELTRRRQPVTG